MLQDNKFWTPAQIPAGKQHSGVHEYACHSGVTWLDVTCQVGIEDLAAADVLLWTGSACQVMVWEGQGTHTEM